MNTSSYRRVFVLSNKEHHTFDMDFFLLLLFFFYFFGVDNILRKFNKSVLVVIIT
jgi:hypothetical protein